jgi:hypothetical protein
MTDRKPAAVEPGLEAVGKPRFREESARLYRVYVKSVQSGITTDKIASLKAEYVATGGLHTRYGYVAPARG